MHLLGTISQGITIVLQLVLLGIICARKMWRDYKWFTAYIVYQVFEGLLRSILFARYGNGAVYGYWYWRTEIFDVVLAIAAVVESWLRIFKLFTRIWWFQAMFWGGAGVLLTYWCLAVWRDPTMKRNVVLSMIWKADLIAVYIPVAIGFLYFILLRFFRLGMPRHETGVILGVMTAEIVALLGASLRGIVGPHIGAYIAWGGVVGYILAELIWIYAFLGPDAAAGVKTLALEDLEDMEKTLSGWATLFKDRTRLPK